MPHEARPGQTAVAEVDRELIVNKPDEIRGLTGRLGRSARRAPAPSASPHLMKIVRIKAGDDIAYGVADAEGVLVYRRIPFVAWEPTETVVPWERAQLLAPVIPTKVVAVGRNYVDHAAEHGRRLPEEPLIFLKPATAVVGPDADVVHPAMSENVHHEAELAAVISRVARNVKAEDASAIHPRLHGGQRRHAHATCRRRTGSGPGPRGSTPSARWARPSRPSSTLWSAWP